MRRLLLCLSAVLLLSSATLACGADGGSDEPDDDGTSEDALAKCGKAPKWTLQMKDDFDSWDDTHWNKADGLVVPNTGTCAMASNVTVSGGMLRIATGNEPACGQPYTGGAVDSYHKIWTGKYFKAEVRAKVSQEQGLFAAPLWFRPGNATGPTNVGGEIDVVETLGRWDNAGFQTTLHADYSSDAPQFAEHHAYASVGDAAGTSFHTYTVEKVKGGVTFYVDGKRVVGWGCGHADNARPPSWYKKWFDESPDGWSFRIDNKVGGGWAGNPDKTTKWGRDTTMVIDYIKLWKPAA